MAKGSIIYNSLLTHPPAGTTRSVSCDDILNGKDVFNLYDENVLSRCEIDASSGSSIDIIFSNAVSCYGAILYNHTLGSGQEPHFKCFTDQFISPPSLDYEFSAIQPGKVAYYIQSTPMQYKYFRITLNASGTTKIGQCILLGAPRYIFDRNYNHNFSVKAIRGGVSTTTAGGTDAITNDYDKEMITLPFTAMGENQKDIFCQSRKNGFALINLDGSSVYDMKYYFVNSFDWDPWHQYYNGTLVITEQPV